MIQTIFLVIFLIVIAVLLSHEHAPVYLSHDVVVTQSPTKVPLYVYTEEDTRCNLMDAISATHTRFHTLGDIIPIDNDILMKQLKKIIPEHSHMSLKYNRLLRDALLFHIVCQTGGILIPSNTIALQDTSYLWNEYLSLPTNAISVYNEYGNSEYGCPIIISAKNNDACKKIHATLLYAGDNQEQHGGIEFNGGTAILLTRLRRLGVIIHTPEGIRVMDTDELVSTDYIPLEYQNSIFVKIPVYQNAGNTSIPIRNQWIYHSSIVNSNTRLEHLIF